MRNGGQGRVQGHRAVACRRLASARDDHVRRDEADLRRRRPGVPRGGVPLGVLRPARAAGARRFGPAAQAAVRDRRGVRCPPHQGRQHPRDAVRARPADRGVRGAVRRRRAAHRRDDRLRDHPVRPQRQHARRRAEAGDRDEPQERRPGHRHVAHGQAADRPRGAQAHPGRSARLGGAERRAGGVHGRPDRRGRSTTAGSRAMASSTSRATSRRAARSATTARGGPRFFPRSCAHSRSRRRSSAPTRRPSRSSAPA